MVADKRPAEKNLEKQEAFPSFYMAKTWYTSVPKCSPGFVGPRANSVQGVCTTPATLLDVIDILVATPLNNSVATRPYGFGDGISIRELTPILWDKALIKTYVSDVDRAGLAKTRYWLCAAGEYAPSERSEERRVGKEC